jgi:PKD repeat protein
VDTSLDHGRARRSVVYLAELAFLAVLAVCAMLVATPARAVVSGEYGVNYRAAATVAEKALKYHGGPVMPASNTYAIYWDPVDAYHNDWMTLIDGYLHNVGADSGKLTNIFSLNGQYTGPGGTRASYDSTFRGAYTDPTPYPSNGCVEPNGQATCLSDAQIRSELKRFIEANHLPTGMGVIYFVLTPPAVTVCTDAGKKGNCSDSSAEKEEEEQDTTGSAEVANGFCGYHSAIEPASANPIIYGVQPWVAGHAGHIITPVPVATQRPTGAALACQNRSLLVEPNQNSTLSRFNGYEGGLADIIINDLSIEQDDIVMDPLLNGWYQDGTHAEQSDLCQTAFSPASSEELPKPPETTHAVNVSNESIDGGSYYLQWALSSVGLTSGKGIGCWQGTELTPHFTATNPVNGGDIVAFDANESGIALDANVTELKLDEPYLSPVYKWDFGDGSPVVDSGLAASVFHSYAHAGNYAVTLTITDSGGNTASVTNTIPVVGPPPAGGGTSGSVPGAPVVSPSGSTPAIAPQSQVLPGPTVTDFVESRSLKKVLSSGLAVRYVVNEQVAGSLQVLLNRSTAKRLGITGTTATGLPKGTPTSIVIGTAVLVTTKAGKGTVRLKFSTTIARRLAHTRQVKLMLRLVVRNGSRESPQTTTQLSTVTLKH